MATFRGRCPSHARTYDQSLHRAGHAIYRTKRWQAARRAYLWDFPLCEAPGCNGIATDVHHRVDLADGGDPYAIGNLQALCKSCHSSETRRRQLGS